MLLGKWFETIQRPREPLYWLGCF